MDTKVSKFDTLHTLSRVAQGNTLTGLTFAPKALILRWRCYTQLLAHLGDLRFSDSQSLFALLIGLSGGL